MSDPTPPAGSGPHDPWSQGQPQHGGQYAAQPYGSPQYGAQPQYGGQYGAQPYGQPPPNHLVWAILTTLFCCLPLGIVSIVFAAQVSGKWHSGDYQGAMESSRRAKTFAIWSAVVGVIVVLLFLGLAAAGVVAGSGLQPSTRVS